MKKIYFVLTFTGTWLSRVVRVYTRKQYAHVSLALDKDLKYMYSFGRINPYNPISGGFVHEVQNEGVFKRFKNTDSLICSIEVTDKQYKKIKDNIKKFESEKDLYGFNVLGLIGIVFGFRVKLNNKFVLYFINIPLLLIILGYHTICFFIELRKLEKIRKDNINKVLTYSKYSFNKFNDNIEILEELEDNKKVEIEILDF